MLTQMGPSSMQLYARGGSFRGAALLLLKQHESEIGSRFGLLVPEVAHGIGGGACASVCSGGTDWTPMIQRCPAERRILGCERPEIGDGHCVAVELLFEVRRRVAVLTGAPSAALGGRRAAGRSCVLRTAKSEGVHIVSIWHTHE